LVKIMKMITKKRILAGFLVGSMLLGTSGCGPASYEAEQPTIMDEMGEKETEEVSDLSVLEGAVKGSINLNNILDGEKDETVYVIADATGNKKSVLVSEWLKNSEGLDEIKDKSILTDIENVKGDETFTQDGDTLTWKANGKPIYYQGKSDKDIPVAVAVHYYLDGEEKTPEEIAGKSGEVKIVFDYTNNAKVGDVYAPFLMGTGLLLDGETFNNVNVSTGKVIADGNRFIVVGLGFPGMMENLDLNIEGFDLPSSVEITATTTSFSLDMALTLATPLTFSEDAFEINLDELKAKLHEKTDEFSDGIDQLSNGVKTYTDGVKQLAGGIDQVTAEQKHWLTAQINWKAAQRAQKTAHQRSLQEPDS